jgi:hypothetical protein
MDGIDYPPCAGRIRPTPATAALFAEIDDLRAMKFAQPRLSPEWLRLGSKVCELSEAIRKIETEGRR